MLSLVERSRERSAQRAARTNLTLQSRARDRGAAAGGLLRRRGEIAGRRCAGVAEGGEVERRVGEKSAAEQKYLSCL